ncbi:MAG: hypothetical protein EB120_06105, partial [Proteobacteria bacterium]|nr:hypothetical protein [Pseudomonadota bacterium]
MAANTLEISPEYWEFYTVIRAHIVKALERIYGQPSDTTYLIPLKGSRTSPRPPISKKNKAPSETCTVHESTDLDTALLYQAIGKTPPVFLIQETFAALTDFTVSVSRDSSRLSFNQKDPSLKMDMWFYPHTSLPQPSASSSNFSLTALIPTHIEDALVPTLAHFFLPPENLAFDAPGTLTQAAEKTYHLFNCSRLLNPNSPPFTPDELNACTKGIAYLLWVKAKNESTKPSRSFYPTDEKMYALIAQHLPHTERFPQLTTGLLFFIINYYKRNPEAIHLYLNQSQLLYTLFKTTAPRKPQEKIDLPAEAADYFHQLWVQPCTVNEETLTPFKALLETAGIKDTLLTPQPASPPTTASSASCAS